MSYLYRKQQDDLDRQAQRMTRFANAAGLSVVAANSGKVEALAALFPAFGEALGGLQSLTRREVLNGESLSRWQSCRQTCCRSPIACRRGR